MSLSAMRFALTKHFDYHNCSVVSFVQFPISSSETQVALIEYFDCYNCSVVSFVQFTISPTATRVALTKYSEDSPSLRFVIPEFLLDT